MPALNGRYQHRYSVWAGNPAGSTPDYERCCEVVSNGIGLTKQCSRKRGFGPDNAYCKQHAKHLQLSEGQL